MTRYQANRLARNICLGFIQQGWKSDLEQVKRVINRPLVRIAKANGDTKTKSELAAEMAKDILLAMGDKLNFAEQYSSMFQSLFNQIYRDLSVDDKKVAKEKAQ